MPSPQSIRYQPFPLLSRKATPETFLLFVGTPAEVPRKFKFMFFIVSRFKHSATYLKPALIFLTIIIFKKVNFYYEKSFSTKSISRSLYVLKAVIAQALLLICEMISINWPITMWTTKCLAYPHEKPLEKSIFKRNPTNLP